MYKIGDFANKCKLSIKVLRHYDRMGLLKPDYIDPFTGYRYYSSLQLGLVNRILSLREAGFSLKEISDLFHHTKTMDQITSLIEKKRRNIEMQIFAEQAKLLKLENLKQTIKKERSIMDCGIALRPVETVQVALMRKQISNENQIPLLLEQLRMFLDKNTIRYSQEYYILNYELDGCLENADMGIAIPVYHNFSVNDEVVFATLQAYDTMACMMYDTSMSLNDAFSLIHQWSEKNDYIIHGVPRLMHLEAHQSKPSIELQIPVRKVGSEPTPYKDMPFADDPDLAGKWQVVDSLSCPEQFHPYKRKAEKLPWQEIIILPEGKPIWIIAGWTKGYIHWRSGDASLSCPYRIQKTGTDTFLIWELYFQRKTMVLALRKLDDKQYTEKEARVYDTVDYPFVNDPDIIGEWRSIDFVDEIESFDEYNVRYTSGDLFFKNIVFFEEGDCKEFFGDWSNAYNAKWTKGLILNVHGKTAEAYTFQRINGCDYLFVEWKSGDYVYGKMKPRYYVFRRDQRLQLKSIHDSINGFLTDEQKQIPEEELRKCFDIVLLMLKLTLTARNQGLYAVGGEVQKSNSSFLKAAVADLLEILHGAKPEQAREKVIALATSDDASHVELFQRQIMVEGMFHFGSHKDIAKTALLAYFPAEMEHELNRYIVEQLPEYFV